MHTQQEQDCSHLQPCTYTASPRRTTFRSLRLGSYRKPTTNEVQEPQVEEAGESNSVSSLQLDKWQSRHILDNRHLNARTKTVEAKARRSSLQAARCPPLPHHQRPRQPSQPATMIADTPLHVQLQMPRGGEWVWARGDRMERRKTCLNHQPRVLLKNRASSYLHIVCMYVSPRTQESPSCVAPNGCVCVCVCVSAGRGDDRK